MQDKATSELLRIPRNKGILGQEIFFIKNNGYIWSLRIKDGKLWGKITLDLGETWQDWQILLTDYDGYFSFTISGQDHLHLICKKTTGELAYILWRGQEIVVNILKDGYLEEEQVTYQTILIDGQSKVHLIYFTHNLLEQVWKIKYCFNENGQWSRPRLLDGGVGPPLEQGAAAFDFEGTLFLIYQTFQDEKFQFVLREKGAYKDSWSERITITASKRSNLNPCLVIDEKGTLHLTWIRSDGMNYRVIYRQKTRGGWMVGGWQHDKELSLPGSNCYSPSIGILDHEVMVFWQQVDGIYKSVSQDEGKVFGEPQLQNQYKKLLYQNLIALDSYKKQGLNTMATFDTGSTSVALLATIFQSEQEQAEDTYLNLPEIKEGPSINYLSLDFGQKGLEEHLQKINGNLQRVFFESEDVRLTNLQMKETISEKTKTISQLEEKSLLKERENKELLNKNKTLEQMLEKLKAGIIKTNKEHGEQISKLKEQINKLKEQVKILNDEKKELTQSRDSLEKANGQLREKINMLETNIEQVEQREGKAKRELEELKNQPFWRKIF